MMHHPLKTPSKKPPDRVDLMQLSTPDTKQADQEHKDKYLKLLQTRYKQGIDRTIEIIDTELLSHERDQDIIQILS